MFLNRASTKTFVSRIHIRYPIPKNSEKNLRYPKNSLAGSLVSRGITVQGQKLPTQLHYVSAKLQGVTTGHSIHSI